MLGRNDICDCGSGKKYKKCCLGKSAMEKIYEWEKESIKILIATDFSDEEKEKIVKAYFAVLKLISEEKWKGACHSSSSILYVMLKEYGINADLVIGEVKSAELVQPYDHSWIEIEGKVFDAAILEPLSNVKAHAPVFYSKNVTNQQEIDAKYGIKFLGLGMEAQQALNTNFVDYMDGFPAEGGLWSVVESLSRSINFPIKTDEIKQRYINVKRKYLTINNPN